MATHYKLAVPYQSKWANQPIFSDSLLNNIDKEVTLHREIDNVLSSAAACINVLGGLNGSKDDIARQNDHSSTFNSQY